MRIIRYTPQLVIHNYQFLPRAMGRELMHCIEGVNGEIVAKRWIREINSSVKQDDMVVTFTDKAHKTAVSHQFG